MSNNLEMEGFDVRICAAQMKPVAGDVQRNIGRHLEIVQAAADHGSDLVLFPELSITAYEPKLASELAVDPREAIFDAFQNLSNARNVSIGVGMPLIAAKGISIGMLMFQPHSPRNAYAKRHLHADELPYFVAGEEERLFRFGKTFIAPAICYESLFPEHAARAHQLGASIYAASVAKSARGIEKALRHYPDVAKKFAMPVVMTNSVGPCDDFVSVGASAVWNERGELLGQLGKVDEALLIYDTISNGTTIARLSGF